jgi:uncharacterized membrane protein
MEKTQKSIVQDICINGIIAATYAALTIAISPLAYGPIQFRFSEIMVLLCFFNKKHSIGLTLGCLLANLASTVGPLDIIFGTLTTLVSCLIMIVYSRFIKNLFFAGFIPCLANAIVIPLVIYYSCIGTPDAMELNPVTYFTMFGGVFLGEFVCIMCVGYPLILLLTKKNPSFYRVILATRNTDYKW